MKTTIAKILVAGVLCFAWVASAQMLSSEINTETATLVPSSQVPVSGTFWVQQQGGMFLPYPSLPAYLRSAPIYALSDGAFVVDTRNIRNAAFTEALESPTGRSGPMPLTPQPDPPLVLSNAWYSQIVISNHAYVSFNAAFLDAKGQPGNTLIPVGAMFPLTATNLTIPLSQWQPIGQTNSIQPGAFNLPYNPNLTASFFNLELQIDPTFDTNSIPPFSAVATNLHIITDVGIALEWTNNQPSNADEQEAVVEVDSNGHSYLVGAVITSGTTGTYSFEVPGTNGLTFVRYYAPAAAPGDQFYVLTNYLNNLDIFTVPYIVDITSGRTIVDVSAYDVTDPSNQQLLGHVSGTNCFQGTLRIPGLSISPGVDTIEFRALDAGGGLTTTDVTITNNRLASIVSPIFELQTNGLTQIAASLGSYKIAFEARTMATNGTWNIEIHNPDGSLVSTLSASITNVGQDIIFDDGGTDQFGWVSYWALFATELNGGSFAFTLDGAVDQANFSYFGSGGTGAVWTGTGGMTLDQFAQ